MPFNIRQALLRSCFFGIKLGTGMGQALQRCGSLRFCPPERGGKIMRRHGLGRRSVRLFFCPLRHRFEIGVGLCSGLILLFAGFGEGDGVGKGFKAPDFSGDGAVA